MSNQTEKLDKHFAPVMEKQLFNLERSNLNSVLFIAPQF